MSTKTTFKRVALVAVAALGFGTLTSVSANAAAATIAIRNSSVTVVDSSSTGDATFLLTIKNDATTSVRADLATTEYICAETIATPNQADSSTKASALTFSAVTLSDVTASQTLEGTPTCASGTIVADGFTRATADRNNPYDKTSILTTSAGDGVGVYAVNVALPSNARGAGYYDVRFRLFNASGVVGNVTAKVKMVATVADLTDATITITPTATAIQAGTQLGQTASTAVDIAVKDANSGLVVSSKMTTVAPTADITLAGVSCDLADTIADDGAITTDYDDQTLADGSFSYKITAVSSTCAGSASIRARLIGAVTATSAVTVTAAAAGSATATLSATGKYSASSTATSHDIPLSTKSVTSSVVDADGTTGKAYYYTVTYTGCVAADMSITADTLTRVLTDSTGVASVTLTNANPVDNCQAIITWSGATTMTRPAHTVTWNAPVATTVVANPGGNFQALLKSTNTVTWTVLDQYGAPVVGKTATFTMSGKNAPTAGLASKVTDANGQVSYTWTDALATDATTDTVGINEVGADNLDAGNVTVTFKTTLSVVAKLKAEYDLTTHNLAAPVLVPATNIGGLAGLSITAADAIDYSKAITVPASGDPAAHWVALKFTAQTSADVAVTGVPTTVTITGGHLIGSDNKIGTSRIVYANDIVWVLGLKTGVATVTATNGSNTATAKINFVNVVGDARVLSATESAGTIIAKVVDFYGNAVEGVTISAVTSGTGRFGNGATSTTFATAADGTVSFDVNGAASVTLSLSASTYAKTLNLANAGDATGAVVTAGAPAGVRTVTVATEGNTVVASTAQAAADAAAEATDAANAATDAANAAAEAADAATAAAQDAADAVAALSTQVSEMVNALKKQITALTNLVIKIQKKVRA
jgi:trimeric autotransporter adhesin